MFLPNRPRPWKIIHHKGLQYYEIRDADGYLIVNFVYYSSVVAGSGFIQPDEALEAAQSFAKLSRT